MRILLYSNHVLQYRQKVYEYFSDEFKSLGHDFTVVSNKFQDDIDNYRCHCEQVSSLTKWRPVFEQYKPDVVILFLHLKDLCMFSIASYCRNHGIKVIYWGYGCNVYDSQNRFKNFLFNRIATRCDAIITYSNETVQNFKDVNRFKTFVACNTVNLTGIDKEIFRSVNIREKYGISQDKILLCVATLKPSKKVDILINALAGEKDIAVVLVGCGPEENSLKAISTEKNIYFLGGLYGADLYELYANADLFTIPGNVGLAINEAFFWGLPLVTIKGTEGAEFHLMEDGKTGIVSKDEQHYKKDLVTLISNEEKLAQMSAYCELKYKENISIENMFNGFMNAINHCFKPNTF